MLKILMVCDDSESLSLFADELSRPGHVSITCVHSPQVALTRISQDAPHVVVTGEHLSYGEVLPFIKNVVKRDPFINCAMVSGLSEKDFYEMTEGLGVFMQLPLHPGAEEAGRMLHILKSIGSLSLKEEKEQQK